MRAMLMVCAVLGACGSAGALERQGYVSGIDVMAAPGQKGRCLAFVSKEEGGGGSEIQVETENAIKRVQVEVTYDEVGGNKLLRRVRLLDRRGRSIGHLGS